MICSAVTRNGRTTQPAITRNSFVLDFLARAFLEVKLITSRGRGYASTASALRIPIRHVVHPFRDRVSVNTVVRVLRPRHAMLRGAPTPTNSQTSAMRARCTSLLRSLRGLPRVCRLCRVTVSGASSASPTRLRRGDLDLDLSG